MQLPPQIRAEIETLAERFPFSELRDAAERLSAGYHGVASGFSSDIERVAYLLVRFPATYAACRSALTHVAQVLPEVAPASLLDLGSGPGTAIAAAREVFPQISKVEAIDRDAGIAMLSAETLAGAVKIDRRTADIAIASLPESGLVTIGYALGEIPAQQRRAVIERAWRATKRLLVVVEPGTPEGYERVLAVRKQLLAAGGQIVAPCPHAERCPMEATKDWCHFAARVERTSLHRHLKRGSLGHEDEKFSYVAFSREPVRSPSTRIVRHPIKLQGHVRLRLCVDGDSIRDEVVTRSHKAQYKHARTSDWGDAWPPILEFDEH